jgi:hypothetical protein
MPARRGTMRKIKEVICLKFEARLSHERIATATGVSKYPSAEPIRVALRGQMSMIFRSNEYETRQ